MADKNGRPATAPTTQRSYVSQTDVPSVSIEQALRIPQAIADNYAASPTAPLHVAAALEMSPTGSAFRRLTGASIAYGLTTGGYNANQIELTDLGRRAAKPLAEGDDLAAKREAMLKPKVLAGFLKKYDKSPLPKDNIAKNVLEGMGVPADRTTDVFNLIVDGARSVGFLSQIKDKTYVDLSGVSSPVAEQDSNPSTSLEGPIEQVTPIDTGFSEDSGQPEQPQQPNKTNRRVFITHGKNTAFIDPIKKLLGFGEMSPVVSTQQQSVSKPVPDKVMDDMRSCGAAIIHVDAESTLLDKEANEHAVINPSVLIEIGAAMSLYGRRFILLVKEGVNLPTNLQGLYEVRYKGDSLDGEATIKLLEAINDIKNNPLPERYQ